MRGLFQGHGRAGSDYVPIKPWHCIVRRAAQFWKLPVQPGRCWLSACKRRTGRGKPGRCSRARRTYTAIRNGAPCASATACAGYSLTQPRQPGVHRRYDVQVADQSVLEVPPPGKKVTGIMMSDRVHYRVGRKTLPPFGDARKTQPVSRSWAVTADERLRPQVVQPDDRNVPCTDEQSVLMLSVQQKASGSSQHAGIDPTECCPVVQGPPCWYCRPQCWCGRLPATPENIHTAAMAMEEAQVKACESGLGGVGSVH